MKTLLSCTAAAGLMLGLGLFESGLNADDDITRDAQIRRQRIRIVDRAAGKHWIGVHAVPIDDALKSHLNLEDRLIVRAVLPDSPAAKAELAQHDILLKFGDRKIKNLEDLLKAVSANKDKAVKLVVLRGGKEVTIDIQPIDRPADIEATLPEDFRLRAPFQDWLGAGGRFRVIGPGVFEELPALPGNLSITVTKQNDEPAKIAVKRNGESWEITENEIDELPEEIREHVRRRLDGRRDTLQIYPLWTPDEEGTIRLNPRGLVPEGINEQLERNVKVLEQLQQAVNKLQQRLREGDSIEAFREEMKSFRRELDKLRQRDQPTDPPATDSRDT